MNKKQAVEKLVMCGLCGKMFSKNLIREMNCVDCAIAYDEWLNRMEKRDNEKKNDLEKINSLEVDLMMLENNKKIVRNQSEYMKKTIEQDEFKIKNEIKLLKDKYDLI
jgi:transcription elongation factor Elf1